MKGKVLLVVGLGVGYVLGARAGRERYDQLAAAAGKVWDSPRVQQQVDRTIAFANHKIDVIGDIVATGTKNIVNRLTGGPKAAPAKAQATKRTPAKKVAPAKRASAKPAASTRASTAGASAAEDA